MPAVLINMLIHQYLENSAHRHPDKLAVIYDNQRVSYRQLDTWATNLAANLEENGVCKGDRVALLMENSCAYVAAYYGILKSGAIAAPLNPALKPDGLQYLLDEIEPAAIIASGRCERLIKTVSLHHSTMKQLVIKDPKQKWSDMPFTVTAYEEAVFNHHRKVNTGDIQKNDAASIIYTSGSTGDPKGVVLSHNNIVSNTASICRYLELSDSDIQMVVLPFFYVMGKSLLNTHIAVGGTVVINNRFMYPADVVHQMISEEVTGFSGVPSTYAYLLNRSPLAGSRDKLPHLRYCSQAGGHMAKATKLALREALPEHTKIYIMYGATEASARLTYLDPNDFASRIESIGKPIPGVSIRIIDDNGCEVSNGRQGELVASGENIMLGYWKDAQCTARVLNGQGYHTGDIGYRDEEGFLYIKQRKDGILKVGGHRVNPVEIEDYLMETDQLIEAVVVGLPDKLMGHSLIALVVLKDNTSDPGSCWEECSKRLPKYKWPADIFSVRALPKNANGKINRVQCRSTATKLQRQSAISAGKQSP